MSATTNRRSASEIVKAMVAVITAIVMPGQSDASVKAFDKVVLFDTQDLTEAFQFLTIVEQRVCLVVPLDEQFVETVPGEGRSGTKYQWTRSLPVMVLCSDRVLGDREAAFWGSDTEMGCEGLAELVLPAVSGLLIPSQSGSYPDGALSGVMACPRSKTKILVKQDEKDLGGRATSAIEFECCGGVMEARLEKGPVF